MSGLLDPLKRLADKLPKIRLKEEARSGGEVPLALVEEASGEAAPEPAPKPHPPVSPAQSPEPAPAAPEPPAPPVPPIQNPEQKFFEAINQFSLEDLRKKKIELERMLHLAEKELEQGIVSQASYEEIRKNALAKLHEVSFELKAVQKLIDRLRPRKKRKQAAKKKKIVRPKKQKPKLKKGKNKQKRKK
jgi:hypothetical protein